MDHKQLVTELVPLVGGAENIKNAIHCQTRLRLTLRDDSLVQDAEVRGISGVVTTNRSAGQYQVIIGSAVRNTYKELVDLIGPFAQEEEEDAEEEGPQASVPAEAEPKKKSLFGVFSEMISGVLTPIFIAFFGCGLATGLRLLLAYLGVIQPGSGGYLLLDTMGNAVYFCLPFLVAASAADYFKCNRTMALLLAGLMMHPNWTLLLSGGQDYIYLFDTIPLRLTSYMSAVIPPILAVYALSKVEPLLVRLLPATVNTVLAPVLTLVVLGTAILGLIGPVANWVNDILASAYGWLFGVASVPASALLAATYPLIVLSGAHSGLTLVMMDSLAKTGMDYIMPLMGVAHCGLAGASLAIFFRTKNKRLKAAAGTGALITGVGLTEPALFGVCLPLKRPLVVSCICSAIGGGFYGYFHVYGISMGLSPLGSIPIYFTDTFLYWLVGAVGTALLSFLGTWLFGYRVGDEKALSAFKA